MHVLLTLGKHEPTEYFVTQHLSEITESGRANSESILDDCPCFDDSVAFAGVMIGVELGNWHYARSGYSWDYPVPATAPFSLEEIGWPKATLRIVVGVVVIFAWREFMKPTLLKALPPIFRVVESLGLNLPRRFFKQAS